MTDILNYLLCPTCGEGLGRVGKSLVCRKGHTFDLAKSGYVNLLPPGKGKNAHTGDDRGMVEARVNFLCRGFYNNISDKTADLLAEYAVPKGNTVSICDMGSGEGWHSCRIAERTGALTGKDTVLLGFDASKHAGDKASKLSRRMGLMPKDGIGAPHEGRCGAYFLPANIFHTPLKDSSVSAALSMFAPVAWDEAARILSDDGILIVVSSGRDHLIEMRRLIYSDVHLSDDTISPTEGFGETAKHALRYTVTLPDKEAIADLFMMTPFCYKTTESGKARLFAKDSLDITVEVTYTVYRKKQIK
ncbi:MAG: hypothetical protein E7638_00540 [Ruminococcaceae bacterium]|nr:hypothetical protein [Oscillospiraceae bacterium]